MRPKLYGYAYRDFARSQAICYPIPFNWIVRWALSLYYLLGQYRPSWWEEKLRKVYQDGFDRATDIAIEEQSRLIRDLEKEYDKGFEAGREAW